MLQHIVDHLVIAILGEVGLQNQCKMIGKSGNRLAERLA